MAHESFFHKPVMSSVNNLSNAESQNKIRNTILDNILSVQRKAGHLPDSVMGDKLCQNNMHQVVHRNEWDPITSKDEMDSKTLSNNELAQHFMFDIENSKQGTSPASPSALSQLYSSHQLLGDPKASPGVIGQKSMYPSPVDLMKQEQLMNNISQVTPVLSGSLLNQAASNSLSLNQLAGMLSPLSDLPLSARNAAQFTYPGASLDPKFDPMGGRSFSCPDVDNQFLYDFDKLNLSPAAQQALLEKSLRGRAPPEGYLCHLCFQKGHYIKDCVLVSYVSYNYYYH